VRGRTSTRLVNGTRIGRTFAAVRGAKLDSAGTHLSLALRLKHPPKGATVSPVVEVLQGRNVVARSRPAEFGGRSMARPSLTLSKPVGHGSHRLRVRVLETVADGLTQDSVVVRKALKASVAR
jgi:hypothetical protein